MAGSFIKMFQSPSFLTTSVQSNLVNDFSETVTTHCVQRRSPAANKPSSPSESLLAAVAFGFGGPNRLLVSPMIGARAGGAAKPPPPPYMGMNWPPGAAKIGSPLPNEFGSMVVFAGLLPNKLPPMGGLAASLAPGPPKSEPPMTGLGAVALPPNKLPPAGGFWPVTALPPPNKADGALVFASPPNKLPPVGASVAALGVTNMFVRGLASSPSGCFLLNLLKMSLPSLDLT